MANQVIVMLNEDLGSKLRKNWMEVGGAPLRLAFCQLSVKPEWVFEPPLGNPETDAILTVSGGRYSDASVAAHLSSVEGVKRAYVPPQRSTLGG